MNLEFKEKYLKYKAKYLELKNNLIGAGYEHTKRILQIYNNKDKQILKYEQIFRELHDPDINFDNEQQIKDAYKQISLKTHPDKVLSELNPDLTIKVFTKDQENEIRDASGIVIDAFNKLKEECAKRKKEGKTHKEVREEREIIGEEEAINIQDREIWERWEKNRAEYKKKFDFASKVSSVIQEDRDNLRKKINKIDEEIKTEQIKPNKNMKIIEELEIERQKLIDEFDKTFEEEYKIKTRIRLDAEILQKEEKDRQEKQRVKKEAEEKQRLQKDADRLQKEADRLQKEQDRRREKEEEKERQRQKKEAERQRLYEKFQGVDKKERIEKSDIEIYTNYRRTHETTIIEDTFILEQIHFLINHVDVSDKDDVNKLFNVAKEIMKNHDTDSDLRRLYAQIALSLMSK
jgi:hypothetical protein